MARSTPRHHPPHRSARAAGVTRLVTGGRGAAILVWGLVVGILAALAAVAAGIPALQAGARADAESSARYTASPAQDFIAEPSFTIAVGTDDAPAEMPAIQSAMTDFLAFSDEFADRLEQGAVAPDFATHEHTMSREAARAQVADGTSVLAVVLPEGLTPTFVEQAAAQGRGERSDPPDPVTVTLVAGPQALTQDEFVLSQYRSHVVNQASEHIAGQMRTVADELGAEADRPVDVVVEEVDGPPAQDLLYLSQQSHDAGTAVDGTAPDGSAAADDPYANAGPQAREAGVAAQADRSFTVWIPALVVAVFGAAVVAATVAVSVGVDRASGLGVILVGPWRRQAPARPVPRTRKLWVKVRLAVVPGALFSLAATVSLLFAARNVTALTDTPLATGASAVLGFAAVLVMLLAVASAVTALVLATAEVVGAGASWCAAVLAGVWVFHASGYLHRIGLSADHPLSPLSSSADLFHTYAQTMANAAYSWIPGVVTAALLTGVLLTAAHLLVKTYDRRVTTRMEPL